MNWELPSAIRSRINRGFGFNLVGLCIFYSRIQAHFPKQRSLLDMVFNPLLNAVFENLVPLLLASTPAYDMLSPSLIIALICYRIAYSVLFYTKD